MNSGGHPLSALERLQLQLHPLLEWGDTRGSIRSRQVYSLDWHGLEELGSLSPPLFPNLS